MENIGVIGAGVMGCGVAQTFAQCGFKVILLDVSKEILNESKSKIRNDIRLYRLLSGEKSFLSMDEIIDNILFTTKYSHLKEVDFIIENVTEKWEVKKAVYEKLDSICKADCIFAVNTSAISISKIASLTRRPSKVIGTHFMNPVPLKPAVETIQGYHTSDETIVTIKKLLGKIKKECILVNDYPGFVSNRVLMLTINEAIFVLQDQVATVREVDSIFKKCFGHKMGPLETADLIGLDTILYSIEILYESYNDSKYRPSPLLKKMVDAGMFGRKSGQGFYEY